MPELVGVSDDALARRAFLDQIRRYVAEGDCQDLLALVEVVDSTLVERLAVQDFKALAHAACTGLVYAIERAHGGVAHARVYRGEPHERVTRASSALANHESGGTSP